METEDIERHLLSGKISRGYRPKNAKNIIENVDLSRVKRDKETLLWVLWKHQVIEKRGPIEEWKLFELCEMSHNWFELILYMTLRDPECNVIRNSCGLVKYR